MSFASTVVRAGNYLRDVRTEVTKVTWQPLEDLRKTTYMIIVVVIIIGVAIGLMDRLFSWIFVDRLPALFG